MSKKVKTKDLFDCRTEYLVPLFSACEYPWEIVPKIKEYIKNLIAYDEEETEELCKEIKKKLEEQEKQQNEKKQE